MKNFLFFVICLAIILNTSVASDNKKIKKIDSTTAYILTIKMACDIYKMTKMRYPKINSPKIISSGTISKDNFKEWNKRLLAKTKKMAQGAPTAKDSDGREMYVDAWGNFLRISPGRNHSKNIPAGPNKLSPFYGPDIYSIGPNQKDEIANDFKSSGSLNHEKIDDIVSWYMKKPKKAKKAPIKKHANPMAANKSSAIARLQTISIAQVRFQMDTVVDQNGNGSGEYGFLQELAGVVNLRGANSKASSAFVDKKLGESALTNSGIAIKNGYCFLMYLPFGFDEAWIAEKSGAAKVDKEVDINNQEMKYRCYAWPLEYGKTGKEAFAIDQSGNVFFAQNKNGKYSGLKKVPNFDALQQKKEWKEHK